MSRIVCPHCQATIDVPDRLLGTRIGCPVCRNAFGVPPPIPCTVVEAGWPTPVSPPIPRTEPPPIPAASAIPRYIHADLFRAAWEDAILFVAVAVVVLLLLTLSAVSLGILAVIVGVELWMVRRGERSLMFLASPVSPDHFSWINDLAVCAAYRLSTPCPTVYVLDHPEINAYAVGAFGCGSVVLHSALVRAMPKNALLWVIGHEFAHIKAGHTRWLVLTNSAGTSIGSTLTALLLSLIFCWWSRTAEFTADRGGLLVVGEPQAAIDALSIVASMQRHRATVNVLSTHPSVQQRIASLWGFAQSDRFRMVSGM